MAAMSTMGRIMKSVALLYGQPIGLCFQKIFGSIKGFGEGIAVVMGLSVVYLMTVALTLYYPLQAFGLETFHTSQSVSLPLSLS
jgi:tetrahydromethanopterin S-methyltransferase subunit E